MEEFLELAQDWDRLLKLSRADSVFLTHNWLACWWESYHTNNPGSTLAVITVREGEELVGAAPLWIRNLKRYGLSCRTATFIGDSTWTEGDFIVPDDRPDVLKMIIDRMLKLKCSVFELGCMPEDSPSIKLLDDALSSRGIKHNTSISANSPCIVIQSGWDEYYSARSTRFKKALRNKLNKISKAGTIEVCEYSESDSVRGVLPSVMELARKGWKHEINNSIASENGNSSFYSSIVGRPDKQGRVTIWTLKLDGAAIAYEYHIEYNNITYAITADYDMDYSKLSPGSVLDYNIVKRKFEKGHGHYDLGSGDSFYKKNWTSDSTRHFNVVAYKNTLYGRLLNIIDNKLHPLASSLKRNRASTSNENQS